MPTSNLIAHGSRTTDDLLQLSLGTTEVINFPSNQRSTMIGIRNNSTTIENNRSLNINDQIQSSSGRKKNLKGLLGDYNSQT